MWQPEKPTVQLGQPLTRRQEWRQAFMNEWSCLAEDRADLEQTADAANKLYETLGPRNPVDVAREEWGTPG